MFDFQSLKLFLFYIQINFYQIFNENKLVKLSKKNKELAYVIFFFLFETTYVGSIFINDIFLFINISTFKINILDTGGANIYAELVLLLLSIIAYVECENIRKG